MDKKQYTKIIELMKKERSKKHFSKNDVLEILKAKNSGDWQTVKQSKLYNNYSGEYCSLLEVINIVFN